VTGGAARLERIWLGLRADTGLPLEGWTAAQERLAARWVEAGWAEKRPGSVRLTPAGWLLLDQLAVEFDAAAEPAPT
jgi:coproporphyrinogen III oxidase-like Fe-S oxidoreductase